MQTCSVIRGLRATLALPCHALLRCYSQWDWPILNKFIKLTKSAVWPFSLAFHLKLYTSITVSQRGWRAERARRRSFINTQLTMFYCNRMIIYVYAHKINCAHKSYKALLMAKEGVQMKANEINMFPYDTTTLMKSTKKKLLQESPPIKKSLVAFTNESHFIHLKRSHVQVAVNLYCLISVHIWYTILSIFVATWSSLLDSDLTIYVHAINQV